MATTTDQSALTYAEAAYLMWLEWEEERHRDGAPQMMRGTTCRSPSAACWSSAGTATASRPDRKPRAHLARRQLLRETSSATPVLAWADVRGGPGSVRAVQGRPREGRLVRATWAETEEMVAAAHVYTTKQYGPDRLAGFSVIPAMSMVSYGAGSRFYSLMGGQMLSFYDWLSKLGLTVTNA
ncbi:molybdopterin-dependent oxidoreductase [Georgenia sp. SUBG003]|uniref:molybdopterin-dependent oxidoreductase n=1 Tax=Georgenia sp. SUBG003 TaxID=1497974 RepID=UPI003AB152A6